MNGPTWWQRQAGATGAIYEDQSLVENYANQNRPAFVAKGSASPGRPHPETFLVKKYGLAISDHHSQGIQAYENRHKVGQAYWAKSILDKKQ